MVAIVDYGVGNLFSLISSFKYIGIDVVVTSDPDVIKESEKIILPGVGAFEDAKRKLSDTGLDKVIIEEAKKIFQNFIVCTFGSVGHKRIVPQLFRLMFADELRKDVKQRA